MTTKNNATMTLEQAQAEIARLQAELSAKNNRALTLYVSEEKGTICISGVNAKFPLGAYEGQWDRVIPFLTGKPIPEDSPYKVFVNKANAAGLTPQRDVTGKDESEDVLKAKHLKRQADTSGLVRHPKNTASA
jgi:hypothetical protein